MKIQDVFVRYQPPRGTLWVIVTQLLSLAFTAALLANMASPLGVGQVYRDVFPSVDFASYMTNGQAEYDWIVRAGGDPSSIRMNFSYADEVYIEPAGSLVIRTGRLEFRHTRPIIYQEAGATRRLIEGRFCLLDSRTAGFQIGPYDHSLPLVIDPQIVMGASFGGSGSSFSSPYVSPQFYPDFGIQVALDAAGNIYLAGHAASLDFPLVNPNTPVSLSCPVPYANPCVVSGSFIAKLDPTGTELIYNTFAGNPSVTPVTTLFPPQSFTMTPPIALAVDGNGDAYVTGAIGALAMKLAPSGKPVWTQSLNVQGAEGIVGTSVALEPSGRVAITGTVQSGYLPVTPNAYRSTPVGAPDIFLIELDSGSGAILYCTYLGPSFATVAFTPYPQVAVSADGGVVVATTTNSADWPTTPGVVQPAYKGGGGPNVLILKLDTIASKLLWATYLGGSGSTQASAIASGPSGDVYVTGTTASTDFPFTSGTVRSESLCESFLTRLNSTATSFVYSACAGGNRLAVDSAGNAFVTGPPSDITPFRAVQGAPIWSTCPVYGTSTPMQHSQVVGYQICWASGTVTAVNPSGNSVLWSTYLGNGTANGVAVDAGGNVIVTGNYLVLDAKPLAGKTSVSVVKIAPDGEPPVLTLTNGASFVPGLPAPGGLATLFASGLNEIDGLTLASGSQPPVELAGVRLLVGGVPAPILAVAGKPGVSQQINFQVPFGTTSPVVELQYGGRSMFTSAPAVGPGIFTLPDGAAAVQHGSDFSPVTRANPINAGENIVIYGTGFGRLAASGSLLAGYPLVAIGQSSCRVLYAGAAPGSVGGYQVNCQVGSDVQSGDQPLKITYNQLHLIVSPPSSAINSNVVTVPVK